MTELDYNDVVSNVEVYGLEESIKACKYSFATSLDSLNSDITPGIANLATTPIGSGHDNFLSGIVVQFDLTFTNKAWVEAERYHFLQIVMSQSTMHRITKFDLDSQYCKYVDRTIINRMKELVSEYNRKVDSGKVDKSIDDDYLTILYSNPAGFKLTARISTNYRQLKTIYAQRKNHRLPEWVAFCKWIETLPHSEFITGGNK